MGNLALKQDQPKAAQNLFAKSAVLAHHIPTKRSLYRSRLRRTR